MHLKYHCRVIRRVLLLGSMRSFRFHYWSLWKIPHLFLCGSCKSHNRANCRYNSAWTSGSVSTSRNRMFRRRLFYSVANLLFTWRHIGMHTYHYYRCLCTSYLTSCCRQNLCWCKSFPGGSCRVVRSLVTARVAEPF